VSEPEPEDPLVCLLPPLPPDLICDLEDAFDAEERDSVLGGHCGAFAPNGNFALRVQAEETHVEYLLSEMRRDPEVKISFNQTLGNILIL
jgi:hypothetical protein